MARFGYTLYSEGNDPRDLIKQAVLAEEAGFDFLVISDHFHPWLTNQEHSAFAWSVLGAVAQATSRIELATMVTCPIMRYHPAIIAQAAATIGVISEGRFTLGLGSGERLNEHIVGEGWPSVGVRHQMLDEAIDIIRQLWQGGYQSYQGAFFDLDDARVFDLPEQEIAIYMGISGPASARLAAEKGIGAVITEPDPAPVKRFKEHGGEAKDVWGQVVLSWADNEKTGLQNAYDQFRFAAGGWKVQAELPNPVNFDAATKQLTPEDLASSIPAGNDPKVHLGGIKKYRDAGVENLAVAYPGNNHEGFMKFWTSELKPKL